MRTPGIHAAVIVAALSSHAMAHAQGTPASPGPGEQAARDYCAYAGALADTARAQLLSPDAFARAGLVQAGLEDTGTDALATGASVRLSVGLRYDVADAWRAGLVSDLARSQCDAQRARERFEGAVRAGEDVGLREGHLASAGVLEAALGEGEAIEARVARDVADGVRTDPELLSTQLRVRRLRERLAEARARAEELGEDPAAAPEVALEDALERVLSSEREQVSRRIDAQNARWWSASVAGGYDRILGTEQALPVFATVQLSLNFGALLEGEARALASQSYESWKRTSARSDGERVTSLERALSARSARERESLERARVFLVDLDRRISRVEGLGGQDARSHRDLLWFQRTELAADVAYLEASLRELDAFRRAAFGAPASPEAGASPDERAAPQERPAPDERIERASVAQGWAVTTGRVEPDGGGALTVSVSKMRAVWPGTDGSRAGIRFEHLGQVEEVSRLGSGAVVEQVGLKLRAQDGCNLIYVMWRLDGSSDEVVVKTKLNPGESTHAQCGNGGYEAVEASERKALPGGPGARTLEARIEGRWLEVFADGERVWRGELSEQAAALEGPAGVRTDNARVRLERM